MITFSDLHVSIEAALAILKHLPSDEKILPVITPHDRLVLTTEHAEASLVLQPDQWRWKPELVN